MAEEITVPDWFTLGLRFTSIHINDGLNLCELMSYDIPNNKCVIQISVPNNTENADWDLQQTLWEFERRYHTIF